MHEGVGAHSDHLKGIVSDQKGTKKGCGDPDSGYIVVFFLEVTQMYTYVCRHIYIHMYLDRDRERKRERERVPE